MSRAQELYEEHYDAVRDPATAYAQMKNLAEELENENLVQHLRHAQCAAAFTEGSEAYEKQIQELKDIIKAI